MQGKLLGFCFIVTVSVFVISLGASSAYTHHILHHNARQACGQLVTVKHPEMKGAARSAEIAKCTADFRSRRVETVVLGF
jgi:hypothetical protein